ncbi:glyoxalase/bleomycin resistance/dioxygenase family protein, partial [bacterium]|nr:glyoxalase/bleomycin resistance/dioxygenase family protein [bacterium]
ELYFEDNDLETLEKTVIREGLEIIHPVREQPWRQKVLRFYDFDGNIVEIGESFDHLVIRLAEEGLAAERISTITHLNTESIRQILHL